MTEVLYQSLIFAQDAAAPEQGDPYFMPRLLFMVLSFGALLYFFFIRPQKRKEDDFRQLVGNLKENDHVVTVGGIYGVVTNVQRDADRITIRVDESTGTKLRISSSAIARVVTDDDQIGDGASGGKSKKS